jgi:hypothetical protein
MYQYENGVKKKNIGFARVEAKNGQCKITLHMQLLGQLDSIFPTYLIQRDENNMELIYLGDTVLKSQVMDSKLTADESNIMNSGYDLSAMGGLLLFLNDNVFFATEWDDKPIVAKDVLAALQPKPKKVKEPIKEIEPIKVEDTIGEAELVEKLTLDKGEKQVVVTEGFNKEGFQQAQVIQEYSIEEELLIPKYKLPRGWKTVERLQNPGLVNAGKAIAVSEVSEPIELAKEAVPQPSAADNGVEEELNNIDIAKMSQEEPIPTSMVLERDSIENRDRNAEDEELDMQDHPAAMHFFEHYPRIYPFEDSEIILCVKIEPKDVGSLPKDYWALSNNSFLMHGFYCYHHLIFAKIKDRFGCRYILGVPGIYHNRERFMARMFGLESFKSIRKRELRQGDFGYWYLPITF